jgi:hypothetical protein
MWTKGAVVIVKHGDDAMGSAMKNGLNLPVLVDQSSVMNIERENFFLKRRSRRYYIQKIREAEEKYGYNWQPPKWARGFFSGLAFLEYLFAVFADKYMTIKE